ncbi:MAG: flagellar hook-length control protein FliK, partial [Dongiaceae bacterium]
GDAARPRSAAPTDLFAVLLRGHAQETDAPATHAPERSAPLADPEPRTEAPTDAPTPEPPTADSERDLPDASVAALAPWLPGFSVLPAPATADVPSLVPPLVPAAPHAQEIAAAPPLPASAAPPAQAIVGTPPLAVPAIPAIPAVPAEPAAQAAQAVPAVPAIPAVPTAADPRPASTPPADAQAANPALGLALGNSPTRSPVKVVPAARVDRPAADSPAFGQPAAAVPPAVPAAPAQIAGLAAAAPGAPIALAAQQVGEAARAAAPGRTKTAGEPAAPGGNPIARVMTGVTPAAGQPPAPGSASPTDIPPVPEFAIVDLAAAAVAKADAAGLGATVPPPHALPGAAPTDQSAAAGARPAVAAPPLPEQLTVHIQKAIREGTDRINIQLRPAELGRIEVRLEFAQDGRLSAAVLADRAETLDLLQRDSRALARAL